MPFYSRALASEDSADALDARPLPLTLCATLQAHRLQLVYGPPSERKCGAWLGGSILASMVSIFLAI